MMMTTTILTSRLVKLRCKQCTLTTTTRPYYHYLTSILIILRHLLRRVIDEQGLKTMRTATAIADIPPVESVLGITTLALPAQ
jgi:hypothetical protein